MFYWVGDPQKVPESFNDDNVLWLEIWNDVFMQYNKNTNGKFEQLSQKNVDTGMGLERVLAVVSGFDDNYKTELFWPIIEKIEKFWIEAQRILLGLKIFHDNGIVHHDLKPQNIVYNEDKNRTNFIDFGLMTTMDKIRDDSNNSKYSLGVLHWSFPLEMEFMNKKHYLQITRLSSTEKEKTHKKFFIERAQTNDSVKTFLHYVLPINSNMWDEMLLNSYNFILKDINENNYNEFLERVIRTIEIY
jgi:serine/threonine protein kinase